MSARCLPQFDGLPGLLAKELWVTQSRGRPLPSQITLISRDPEHEHKLGHNLRLTSPSLRSKAQLHHEVALLDMCDMPTAAS